MTGSIWWAVRGRDHLVRLVTPGKTPTLGRSRGHFPLRLGGNLLGGPAGVGVGVVKAHIDHRQCFGPGARFFVGQPFTSRMAVIAALGEKNAELAVRDFVLVDVIAREPDRVCRLFRGLSVIASHRERVARNEHHGAPSRSPTITSGQPDA